MTLTTSNSEEAARIRERLAQLGAEQAALKARLAEIETQRSIAENGPRPAASVTGLSPAHDKIAIFRSLFGGREDVYPKRWENAKTGKAGYAPVCANEWAPRLCGKPRVPRIVACAELLSNGAYIEGLTFSPGLPIFQGVEGRRAHVEEGPRKSRPRRTDRHRVDGHVSDRESGVGVV